MSANVAISPAEVPTLDQQHQHLREVHEHLRHAATADGVNEIRERMRLAELALQRHERAKGE